MSLIKRLTENVLRDVVETNRTDSAIAKALKPFFHFTHEEAMEIAIMSSVKMQIGKLKMSFVDDYGLEHQIRQYIKNGKEYRNVQELQKDEIMALVEATEKKSEKLVSKAVALEKYQLTLEGFEDNVATSDDGIKFDSVLERSFYARLIERIPEITRGDNGYKVGRYKYDFAHEKWKVLIEIDGHEYHRSLKARQKDERKTILAMKGGWLVIRFTASSVYKNQDRCIDEILAICSEYKRELLSA
jgi:very-short-patch-repair endonuclease